MPNLTITLDLVRFGEPETGGWCDSCLLPSLVTQRVAAVLGMTVLATVAASQCTECGRERTSNG